MYPLHPLGPEYTMKQNLRSLGGGLALCTADLRLLAALLLDLLQRSADDRAVDLRGFTRAVCACASRIAPHAASHTPERKPNTGEGGIRRRG